MLIYEVKEITVRNDLGKYGRQVTMAVGPVLLALSLIAALKSFNEPRKICFVILQRF